MSEPSAGTPAVRIDSFSSLQEEVEFLCSPALEGRAFGTPGATAASFYVFRQFRNAGLRTSFQSFSHGDGVGHNVIGVTKGWYRRYIVVSAYLDGLGVLDDKLYAGADANASGVAVLLSLARMLPALCRDGHTGLIFVAFDGHNAGLSGSKKFLESFAREYEISMIINMELLGTTLEPLSASRPEYLIALGGENYASSLLRANNEGLDLSFSYYGSVNFTDLFYRRASDQRWFLEAEIPAVMFTSGITVHTYKVSDTPDTIDYRVLAKRRTFIARWISRML